MNNVYISIGSQCTTTTLFDKLRLKKESLPFDWMISTPHFVYTIMKFLFIDKKELNDIIDNHFFACDKKGTVKGLENYITNENGSALVNSKYKVCFPHDKVSERDKYIRRLERLKQIILDKGNFIYFVYVSVSSQTGGNYTLDGVKPIEQLYEYIENINNILKDIRTNYKILVFDTNKPPHVTPSDILHIEYYDIEKKSWWGELLPELIDKFNKQGHKV